MFAHKSILLENSFCRHDSVDAFVNTWLYGATLGELLAEYFNRRWGCYSNNPRTKTLTNKELWDACKDCLANKKTLNVQGTP